MVRFKSLIFISFIVLTLVGCQSVSPEQIVEKALAATEESQTSYYGEIEIKGDEFVDGDIEEDVLLKEWNDGKRSRNEVISDDTEIIVVQNDSTLQMYHVKDNIVYETTDLEEDMFSLDPKEQMNLLLDGLRDTHDIETLGKEEVANRQTHHLKATVREDVNTILGDLELWIDEEHWIPLRTRTKSGEIELEVEYVHIDFDKVFSDSIFELDVPEDVTVETLDMSNKNKELTIEELASIFDKPTFILAEEKDWEIESITLMEDEIEGDPYKLVDIEYTYKGIPTLTLMITEAGDYDPNLEEELLASFGDLAEKVTIRGIDIIVIDSDELLMFDWEENQLEYSIHVLDTTIDQEKILQAIEVMTEVK